MFLPESFSSFSCGVCAGWVEGLGKEFSKLLWRRRNFFRFLLIFFFVSSSKHGKEKSERKNYFRLGWFPSTPSTTVYVGFVIFFWYYLQLGEEWCCSFLFVLFNLCLSCFSSSSLVMLIDIKASPMWRWFNLNHPNLCALVRARTCLPIYRSAVPRHLSIHTRGFRRQFLLPIIVSMPWMVRRGGEERKSC